MYKAYLIRSKSMNISKYRHEEKLTSLINKKTIRHHLDKLIREYNIFPEKVTPLNVVKHSVKILFWATVYLTFSYLTITSTYKVIQQYHDGEITTNMKAKINNNVTFLPNMTICFKINAAELFNISFSSSLNYTSAWSRFFENTTLDGIFIVDEGQVYEGEIYLSLLKYLAMIYEAERAWEPGLTQISTFHSEESDDWIALKKVLMPNIERFNITLEQLKSLFGEKLCSLPESDYSFSYLLQLNDDYNLVGKCVAGSKISFIGMDTICFRLIGYQYPLLLLGTAETITLNLYDDGENQKWYQELTIDFGSESRSTPRRATTRNETYAFYYDRFTDTAGINMDIGVKALYRKLPYVKSGIQCSSDTSREECENKCLKGWIEANCHCSPITFNLTDTSGYRNCLVDEYSTCLKKYAENTTNLCTNKCVPLCEQWHYGHDLAFNQNRNFSSEIEISLKTFDYVIIEQVFTWNSFEEFIGALGGALGIWLGLDFVIIIEFIVRLVTKLVKKILLKNVLSSEEDKHRISTSIKHREENVENGISSSNGAGSRVVGNQKKCKKNESELVGTSIRPINESEEQRTSRKKRESKAWKENHVQQRTRRSSNNRANSVILDDTMKNIDSNNGRLRNQKVNITNNVEVVQDESSAHAHCSSARSWFLQKMLLLLLNGEASTNKPVMFLRLVETLFWTGLYLVGSVFTTLWCVDLINLYLADEAVYYPTLTINRTISMPPPSLCIDYDQDNIFKGQENISVPLLDYFGRSEIDRASFLQISEGKDWPDQLVSIGLLYFKILANSETWDSDVNFTSEYEWRLHDTARNDTLRNDIEKSLHGIFLPKLLEWNITANELRQKLGTEIARMAELKISFLNSNGTTDIVNEASFYTAAISGVFFCYSLPYAANFTNPGDALEFSINRASYPQLILNKWSYIFFSDYILETDEGSFSICGTPYTFVYDSIYYWFDYGSVKKVVTSVRGLYTSRPAMKDVKYCSSNTTKSYCRAQCRIELIEKICNCSPTYWTAMIQPTSGLDECTFDRYMECLYFNARDDLDCKYSCLPFCTARYSQSESTTESLPQEYSDTAVIRFSVKDGIYESIEEKPIFTFSDLLIKV